MTEDNLNYYYYDLVETLWLGGIGTRIERIQDRTRPKDAHIAHLNEGLGALVERKWLKVSRSLWAPGAIRSSTRGGTSRARKPVTI
jgi:hypothetical protein